MPSRVVAAVDACERCHRWLGFPLAVVYKFGDVQGPYLAALRSLPFNGDAWRGGG